MIVQPYKFSPLVIYYLSEYFRLHIYTITYSLFEIRIQTLYFPLFILVIQDALGLDETDQMPLMGFGSFANSQPFLGVFDIPQISLHGSKIFPIEDNYNENIMLAFISSFDAYQNRIIIRIILSQFLINLIIAQLYKSDIEQYCKQVLLYIYIRMDIYDTWKLYKQKIEKEILAFNNAIKLNDFDLMTKSKDSAKNYYLKFVQLLKLQSRSDQNAFKEILDDFQKDIRKMGEYIKNNQGKKVLANNNNDAKTDKDSMTEKLANAIISQRPDVKWDDVAGLLKAKQALKQAVIMPIRFPQIFTGARKPWKGILLYGPPGTGKTFLAKACASQMEGSTFFSVSSSDIMSKYVGQAEKMVKYLFEMARKEKSSVIFIDEVDSMTGNRSDGDNESSKRVKTEFLVQMEGVGKEGNRLLVLGATNLPWELDPAIRRRFQRRIYIPLPELQSRLALLKKLCQKTPNTVNQQQFYDLAQRTQGYSGSDIKTLVKDAVYQPLRISQKANKFRKTKNQKGEPAWIPVPPSENIKGAEYCNCKLNDLNGKLVLPDLEYKHFVTSLIKAKPSVDQSQLARYEEFTKQYGQDG